MSKQFDYSKHPIIHFASKNIRINRQILGVAGGFYISSLINGSDKMSGCEFSSLSCVRPIINGAPK